MEISQPKSDYEDRRDSPKVTLGYYRQWPKVRAVRPDCMHVQEEPVRRYALYIPTIGKRRPGRERTSYLNYVQRLLGDNEGAMQEQQIAAFADDRRAWRNLVVACSAADG